MNYKVANKFKPFLYLIDCIGNLLFFWKKFKKIDLKKINRIAVIRIDHIGDCIMTFPFFDALKERFPNAEISVITRQTNKEILELNKSIDKIIILNPPWFSREKNGFSDILKFIKSFYKTFDLVFELHSDPRNIIFASLIGKYSTGYGIRGFGFLLNKVVNYAEEKTHTIQRNLDVLVGIVISTEFSYPVINLEEKDISKDISLMKKLLNQNKAANIVCISPGAGRKDKYWLNERWAALCNKLIENYDATIIFTGDKKEEKNIAEIKKNLPSKKYTDLCSKTNLKQLCAVIKNCKLVITPDSAPMHIAKALSVPSIALFNLEDPIVWGYNDDKNISISKNRIENINAEDIISQIEKFKLL